MKITKKKLIISGVAVLAIAATAAIIAVNGAKKPKYELSISENDIVLRGDVEETITGSSAVEPYERYEIISLVSGDIISSPFEVGDTIKEGDLLYKFDTESASINIERQEISLEQSKNNYNNALEEAEKLTIKATCSGVISGLEVKQGKEIQNNFVVATIENTNDLELELPFNYSQINNIFEGDIATVSSSIHMSGVSGTVSHVAKNPTAQADGSMLYNVTIKFKNPGSFTKGLIVGGEVKGMISPGSGAVKVSDSEDVKAEVSGSVENIYVSNGDFVNQGDIILTLTSDTVSDNIKNSSLQYKSSTLSLQETRDSLDDYSLTSPINGTVLTKNAKAGDTIDRNSSTQVLMVVADISKLKFTLSIDELDISKVEVGQNVKITCDALENEEYMGKITNVSVEGTSTNGVTVYEAEVVIDEPGNLRPSMNIDATVVFASSEDTLIVPSGDIKTVMGKSFVFLKDDETLKEEDKGKADLANKKPEKGMPQNESGGEIPERIPEAPEGYKTVEVTIGLSNDEYTEVLSGLKEGDEIYRIATTSSNSANPFMMGAGMGGNMSGMGGMGGMSGGPSNMRSGPAAMGGGMR